MEFLNPTAFYGFLALPLLLIPYLVRRKPRRMLFSTVLLFSQMGSRAAPRPWGRLRLPPIFFVQLLLLVLLLLALADPVISVRPTRLALVVDNSASMQALENGASRFALAQSEAAKRIADLGPGASVDVYRTAPGLAKTHAAPLSAAEAERHLRRLRAYDVPDPPALGDALERLAADRSYDRIDLITDRPAANSTPRIRVVTVGKSKSNLALTSLQIGGSSITDRRAQATVEIMSYAPKEEKVRVLLHASGKALASREVTVPAGRSVHVTFEGLPLHPSYRAELIPGDALAIDNHRFAVPRGERLKILGVSPRPQELATLRAIPGIRLDLIAPDQYGHLDRRDYSLEIFHFAAPAELPGNPALFVLPPDRNPLAAPGKPVTRPVISSWLEAHPLTRYVNFALFRVSYARPLQPLVPGSTIVESPAGPLAFSTEQRGTRYLVLGFDPLPYLGRENLPVSIFTLNFLDWLFGAGGAVSLSTGAPFHFPPAAGGETIQLPDGKTLALEPGTTAFRDTFSQGIYSFRRGGKTELVAVNLDGAGESDLRQLEMISFRRQSNEPNRQATLFSLWPYLLALALLLLVLEWYWSARTGQVMTARPKADARLARDPV